MSDLSVIAAKAEAGERLSREDGLALYASDDLAALGRLADAERRRRHGLAAYYIINTHVNYTNACLNRCRFCAFARDPGDADAYLLDIEEILDLAAPDVEAGADRKSVV